MLGENKGGPIENNQFYETLGVNKNASADEIRKAYKKIAIKSHPDKGGDATKFQELQNAYEILSDPQKREVYDTYGKEGLLEDFDPFPRFWRGYGRGERQKQKCKVLSEEIKITLEDAYMGGKKFLEFSRRIICERCLGSGLANPNDQIKCTGCNGKKVKIIMRRMGEMMFQTQQSCDECNGTGQVIKDKCIECKAEKVVSANKKIEIELDKGVPDEHLYTFKNEGDEYPEFETGDVSVKVFIEKHKDFIRKGADLVYKKEITLLQALTGFEMLLFRLDGKKIFVKSSSTTQPGYKTIKEMGMPFYQAPYRMGNIYIDFEVVFPDKLDSEEIEKLGEILKQKRLNKSVNDDIETHFVSEFKVKEENTHYGGGKESKRDMGDDEDLEGEGGLQPRITCPNQ